MCMSIGALAKTMRLRSMLLLSLSFHVSLLYVMYVMLVATEFDAYFYCVASDKLIRSPNRRHSRE